MNRIRIIMADDNPDICFSVRKFLKDRHRRSDFVCDFDDKTMPSNRTGNRASVDDPCLRNLYIFTLISAFAIN